MRNRVLASVSVLALTIIPAFGQATTAAVVQSLLAMLVTNAILTSVFFFA